MAQKQDTVVIPDEELAADSRVDAIASVLLVALAVITAIFWISGH
jgi:hypothetical protein